MSLIQLEPSDICGRREKAERRFLRGQFTVDNKSALVMMHRRSRAELYFNEWF